MKHFQPQNENVNAIRVLLYGPVGPGKSTFINSVNSILQGRMTQEALANNITADESFTKKYQTYEFKKEGRGNFYPFVFNDIMGLEGTTGVRAEDIKLALKGHVKDGYKFNPSSSISAGDPAYISDPSVSDRVHVLVCIYSANASEMNFLVLQKMREIREAASDLACRWRLENESESEFLCPGLIRWMNVFLLRDLSGKRHHFAFTVWKGQMSGQTSIPSPPSSSRLANPWIYVSWGEHERDLHFVANFRPVNGVRHIRVLLYGPVGAGKSSFITSVSNALRRRMTCEALANAANSSGQSFSKKYSTHRIRKEGKGNYHCVVLNDTMGLEEGLGRGIHTHDIKLAMMGHVKEGYKFNPLTPLCDQDPYYNSSPSLNDRVHVMVCVHNANAPNIKPSILLKLRDIREAAKSMGVPQLAVLTNIDEACIYTKINLRNVYRSKNLKKKISNLHSSFGIPESNILPVKNYSHEIQTCSDVDTLILRAVRRMVDLGHDFTDKVLR